MTSWVLLYRLFAKLETVVPLFRDFRHVFKTFTEEEPH